MPTAEDLRRADESLARRFTLAMNAATWRYGLICDVIFASLLAGVAGIPVLIAAQLHLRGATWALGVVALSPWMACAVSNLMLLRARRRVLEWVASLPFPVDNVNAVLAGLGENFEIAFQGEFPKREEVMAAFEKVSDDVFVLEVRDAERTMLARFGVMDSKHNPHRQNHQRYERLREVMERSLRPLHDRYPIAGVRIV